MLPDREHADDNAPQRGQSRHNPRHPAGSPDIRHRQKAHRGPVRSTVRRSTVRWRGRVAHESNTVDLCRYFQLAGLLSRAKKKELTMRRKSEYSRTTRSIYACQVSWIVARRPRYLVESSMCAIYVNGIEKKNILIIKVTAGRT